jgi:hypothetical protein
VPDGNHADRFSAVSQLVEDPIGPYPQRVQAAKFPPQGIAGERIALEQTKRILDRIDQRPCQIEQVSTRAPGKDESSQRSACGWPTFSEFAAQLGEGDRLPPLDLAESSL